MNRLDLGSSLVATAPSPATSGTSLIVTSGTGSTDFPAPPFWGLAAPAATLPTLANSEIVLVTGVSTDTFTIVRAQKGTTAMSIAIGWTFSNVFTTEDAVPTGAIQPYAAPVASPNTVVPAGYLLCYGQAVSQTTYAALFNVLNPNIGAVTSITNATPAVVTLTAHGLQTGDAFYFTGGTLGTGLTTHTVYYAHYVSANTFNVSTSIANAYGGTYVATSGASSGTIDVIVCPYQAAAGYSSSNFNVPDLRGRNMAGNDYMGGTAAARLNNTSNGGQGTYGNLGASGGEQAHTQVVAEMYAHYHAITAYDSGSGGGGQPLTSSNTGGSSAPVTNTVGSGDAFNIVSPVQIVNYIIKT